MHAVRKYPLLRYDGTNTAEVLGALGGHQFVSEVDGVLTVRSLLGGELSDITEEWAVIDGSLYSPEQLAEQFYIVPEA